MQRPWAQPRGFARPSESAASSQRPPGRGVWKTFLNEAEDLAGAHLKNWLVHAARIHFVFLLIGRGDLLEHCSVLKFFCVAFDNYRLHAVVVRDRASGVGGEVLAFTRFAAGREKERAIEPYS